MPETMTFEEWLEHRKSLKDVKQYLEEARQTAFAKEQQRESVMTREFHSIVDVNS